MNTFFMIPDFLFENVTFRRVLSSMYSMLIRRRRRGVFLSSCAVFSSLPLDQYFLKKRSRKTSTVRIHTSFRRTMYRGCFVNGWNIISISHVDAVWSRERTDTTPSQQRKMMTSPALP
jgi:hypothetical protein